MNELAALTRAVQDRRRVIERADAAVTSALLRAYRAKRDDGMPKYTLSDLGAVLGVTRQRAYQLVREVAGGQEERTRSGSS